MSAHIYTFGGTRELQEQRRHHKNAAKLERLVPKLTQETLELSLAKIMDDRMRAACFETWKPHLTFLPADDTLERAYEIQLAKLREAERNPMTLVSCDACSMVANCHVQHVQGHCVPGPVIAATAPDHIRTYLGASPVPPLVLLPPGVTEADLVPPEIAPADDPSPSEDEPDPGCGRCSDDPCDCPPPEHEN